MQAKETVQTRWNRLRRQRERGEGERGCNRPDALCGYSHPFSSGGGAGRGLLPIRRYDRLFCFGVFTMGFQFFMLAFRMVLQSLIGTSMNALLSLMFRIGGVYLAYTTSRFV